MTRDDVVILMRSSQSEAEWHANCDRVKAAHGGALPPYWDEAILESGVWQLTQETWG